MASSRYIRTWIRVIRAFSFKRVENLWTSKFFENPKSRADKNFRDISEKRANGIVYLFVSRIVKNSKTISSTMKNLLFDDEFSEVSAYFSCFWHKIVISSIASLMNSFDALERFLNSVVWISHSEEESRSGRFSISSMDKFFHSDCQESILKFGLSDSARFLCCSSTLFFVWA